MDGDNLTSGKIEPTTNQRIASALERIATAMERQSLPIVNISSVRVMGCTLCGRGSDGRAFDHYLCGRSDCPSRVTYLNTTTAGSTGGPR